MWSHTTPSTASEERSVLTFIKSQYSKKDELQRNKTCIKHRPGRHPIHSEQVKIRKAEKTSGRPQRTERIMR